MEITTNLRKMRTSLDENSTAQYLLPIYDIIEYQHDFSMNSLIGQKIQISYEGQINCVETGKRIKKTFGEGLSYDSFLRSPLASPSIIKPELSRIHEGIALRDEAWEREHHLTPHYVYLSRTSHIKVGVTRTQNVPSRWIDQGATEAIILAETPYRQLAGLIEVSLKDTISDKTSWQAMLKNTPVEDISLKQKKHALGDFLPDEYQDYISENDTITQINYPVLVYPSKIKSIKLDDMTVYENRLIGIKGQYLLFDHDQVLNIRSHAGYRIRLKHQS
jgi:Protein of unknown function (DUF2797)